MRVLMTMMMSRLMVDALLKETIARDQSTGNKLFQNFQ